MRDYKSYIDHISVDAALHNKIMARVAKKPARSRPFVKFYAAAAACAAIVLLSVWGIPGVNPSPSAQPDNTALYFNVAEQGMQSDRLYIPGYFTQELSQEKISQLFGSVWPAIQDGRNFRGSAGFSGEGVLDDIYLTSEHQVTGLTTSIQLANGPVFVDYLFPDEPKVTDVSGTAVTAGYWNDPSPEGTTIYYASFEMGTTGYYLELAGDDKAKAEITSLVNLIITGGAADLKQVTPDNIPKWREDQLTLNEALSDPDFGAFVPAEVPAAFGFASAWRIQSQNWDGLRVSYSAGMKYLEWTVASLTEASKAHIVDINKPEMYDLTLYSIPFDESVPMELSQIVANPFFRAEDLTLDVVSTRAITVNETGDESGIQMHFSVLFGDTVVEISSKGLTPEDIFKLLQF